MYSGAGMTVSIAIGTATGTKRNDAEMTAGSVRMAVIARTGTAKLRDGTAIETKRNDAEMTVVSVRMAVIARTVSGTLRKRRFGTTRVADRSQRKSEKGIVRKNMSRTTMTRRVGAAVVAQALTTSRMMTTSPHQLMGKALVRRRVMQAERA
jgi:hypothetical protein